MSLPIYLVVQDTDTRITVSSISDVSCFNPERVITIKGNIPNISQAEAEVGTTSCTAACSVIVTNINISLQVSTKLRAAYETDLAAMTPHSLMFPGLPPAAMMSTATISSHPGPAAAGPSYTGPGHRGAGPAHAGAGHGAGAGRSQLPASQIPTETTYLYIPNTAVGAIIGR